MKRLVEGLLSSLMLISLCTIMIEVQMIHSWDLLFNKRGGGAEVADRSVLTSAVGSSLHATSQSPVIHESHNGLSSVHHHHHLHCKETMKKRMMAIARKDRSQVEFVKSKFISGQWLWGDFTYIDFPKSTNKRSGVVYTLHAYDGNELHITGYFDDYSSRLTDCMTLSNNERSNYHLCDLEIKKTNQENTPDQKSKQLVCIRFEQDQGVKLAIHLNPLDCFSSTIDFAPTLVGDKSSATPSDSGSTSNTIAAVYIAPGQTSSRIRDFIVVLGASCAFVCGFVILCSVACGVELYYRSYRKRRHEKLAATEHKMEGVMLLDLLNQSTLSQYYGSDQNC
ncbi:hypothetical protein FDP41_005021 [Naegleria fowleri]|uniref:Uncharacterized protein n=1 Tax=Naegleria fowleri TaxID=5763 RepID=A0A6A5BNM3_NAEFO|nr:uncharacterized protein FDP41_005021 [Naegleria fowleri]KAF0975694.1 hypothetical protein FDP41_005021 [Naegleria fowleri]